LERMKKAVDRIARDCARAGDIIHRTRAMVKKTPARQDQLDVNQLLVEVIELTRGEMATNGVRLQTQLAEGLPRIRGDRVQLQQVIMNLTMNAVEAMSQVDDRPRGLLIGTESERGGVRVSVRDSGPGLNATALEQVFEAFFTTKASGMGMGLSISRSIV